MNISPELEKLIRQLLALGLAVIVVVVAPNGSGGTGGNSPQTIVLTPSASPRSGSPSEGFPSSRRPTPSSERSSVPESGSGTPDAAESADGATTAADTLGWGEPNRVDTFDTALGPGWEVYDGPGHDGQGRRSPSAVSVADGVLTITGDSAGTTAGMAWKTGQKYGRWEGRVKAPVGDPSYNALLLLWPDAEDWPVGGEIDFMEISDVARKVVDIFVHFGEENSQVNGKVDVDATEWHNWAVEWTPEHIAAYLDGKQWYRTTDKATLPPGPMHLCIQLDWFPKGDTPQTSTMQVDWVKQYPLTDTAAPQQDSPPSTAPR